jgi:hypothetical protein
VQDGVFVYEGTRASIKDTPLKEFEEGLKKCLEEAGLRNTTTYILEHLEKYARARLEAPTTKRKKGQRAENFQKELESNERQRRDCESLLREIKFLRTISGRKENDHNFLMARFYYLGVLGSKADIRPIEPVIFQGARFSDTQSEKAQKPRTRNNMTPAQRRERDEKIVRSFKKSPLNCSSFSQKNATKYGLQPRQIRRIIKKALGH